MGYWWAGCYEDCPGRRLSQLVDDEAVAIDRHRVIAGAEPGQLGTRRVVAGILDRDRRVPGVDQLAGDEAEPVREAVADHHLVGVGDDAADPTEVLGDGDPQLPQTARVDVSEVAIGKRLQGRARRP